MYSQLFNWLRDTINEELTRSDKEWDEGGRGACAGGAPTIGLLDIFGFESFAVIDSKTKTWVRVAL